MKFIKTLCLLLLVVILLNACTPGLDTIPASPSFLPDLVVSTVYLGMQGVPTNWAECIPNYGSFEIRALIQNLGQASAYKIDVVELATGTKITIGELGAGQGMELYFPVASANAAYNVAVDPQNITPESNEDNNTFSYLAITPTPPVLCTPTSDPSSNLSMPIPAGGLENVTLSQSVLQNGIYRSPDWGEFQLADGIYTVPRLACRNRQRATPPVSKARSFGDINADGLDDALVVLSTQNDGSGHFIELPRCSTRTGVCPMLQQYTWAIGW